MKRVVRYQSNDGAEFSTKEECEKHEDIIRSVNRIMKPLGKLPKDRNCDFADGGGYIPHNPQVVTDLKIALVSYGCKLLKIKDEITFGAAGRYFDESCIPSLYWAWSRLANIDNKGREWGQMYYALNPKEGKQKIYKEE